MKQLRVLLVTKQTTDIPFVHSSLEKTGFVLKVTHIKNYQQLLLQLNPYGWDLIIADYDSIPITAALKIYKEQNMYTPFIIISERINEACIVDSMRSGAHDFVSKKNWDRLAPAVLREVIATSTRQKKQHALFRLQENEEKYRNIFMAADDALFIIDADNGQILDVNNAACRLYGYSKHEMFHKNFSDLTAETELTLHPLSYYLTPSNHRCHRNKAGTRFPVDLSLAFFTKENYHFCSIAIRDITEQKNIEDRFRYLSQHDSLTELYNRAYFEAEMLRLAQKSYSPVGIIVGDIDGLKLVNDTLGNETGDVLLMMASGLLREASPPNICVARTGGDEFAILLPNSSRSQLEQIAKTIRANINKINLSQHSVALSLSIGYALSDTSDSPNLIDCYKQADTHMYREKLHRNNSARSSIVQTAMKLLEARDFITEGHADRMQDLAGALGRTLHLPETSISDLRLLAQFHDIGKIGIPDRILFKPAGLSKEEYAEMQRHCEIGYRIAYSAPDLVPIADQILKHHEWWNGNGYPFGLSGENIPLACRILSIVDAFDAMTSDRPYRKALSPETALAELWHCAGKQFDPKLVAIFATLIKTA